LKGESEKKVLVQQQSLLVAEAEQQCPAVTARVCGTAAVLGALNLYSYVVLLFWRDQSRKAIVIMVAETQSDKLSHLLETLEGFAVTHPDWLPVAQPPPPALSCQPCELPIGSLPPFI
jgi:hypothetical protein